MQINKIKITNFKCLKETLKLDLNESYVIVGDNNTGKTTIVEAIDLA